MSGEQNSGLIVTKNHLHTSSSGKLCRKTSAGSSPRLASLIPALPPRGREFMFAKPCHSKWCIDFINCNLYFNGKET